MQNVQLSREFGRVESGAVQFEYVTGETDWPGYFMRGDSAFVVATAIGQVLARLGPAVDVIDHFAIGTLRGVMDEINEQVITKGERSS